MVIRFLGFLCDSLRQFFLPDKKVKFRSLRESILSSSLVNLKTLQRFAGKVVSFSLAIPGSKLTGGQSSHCDELFLFNLNGTFSS